MLAVAPGIFWLWFFARKDVYRPGPRRLLAFTFFLGMLSVVPAGLLEWLLVDEETISQGASIATAATTMLLVVGPVEELSKFAAVRLGPYRSLYFDEPMDGLVYAAAASLGFASAENFAYILQYGPAVMLARAPLSTLAHAVFGSIWGYALGLQVQRKGGGVPLLAAGLGVAAVAHGLFNVAAISNMVLLALGLIVAGAVWTAGRFDWAQRISPFRYRQNYPRVQCRACLGQVRVTSRYCRFCGAPAGPAHEALFCGCCGARNRPDASYCTQCGDRLLS